MEINQLFFKPAIRAQYMGQEFLVPEGTTHLAIDKSGELFPYSARPELREQYWQTEQCFTLDPLACVSDFGDWRESLREVTPC